MKPTVKMINDLLSGKGISEISCYQDFVLSLAGGRVSPYVLIRLGSQWRVNSQEWWDEFVTKFPIDTKDIGIYPYGPVQAFILHVLSGLQIVSASILEDNSLEIVFEKKYVLHIPGRQIYNDPENSEAEPEYELSWAIYNGGTLDDSDFAITVNGNGKMIVKGSLD